MENTQDSVVLRQVRVPGAFIARCEARGVNPDEVIHSLLDELVNLNPHFHKEAQALFQDAVDEVSEAHTYSDDREAWG